MNISIIFEDFFREFEAFSRIVKLLKYIFSGIDTFLSNVRLLRNVSVAFIKPIVAEAFWWKSTPVYGGIFSSSDYKFWQ
jgi:hypothetical protein